MGKRSQTETMRRVVRTAGKCELCGSTRGLEAHHIIPIAFGGDDSEENILCVCAKCHGLLTPRSILSKRGIHNNNWEVLFWQHFDRLDGHFDVFDVLDYLDDELFPLFRSIDNNK